MALFLLIIFFSNLAHADIVSEAMEGQELLLQRNYGAAVERFERLEREFPNSPTGSFGQMAAWQLRMFENLDFNFKDQFKEAEKKFEQLANDPTSEWDMFVAAAGHGMRGFYYARDGKWFRALGCALHAVRILKDALYKNPNFADAYLGIGMYNYWRSVMTSGLNFLPFFGDRRAEGIGQVELVVRDGKYANKLSEANLAFMYSKEKRYADARRIVDKFLKEYPNNIIIRQLSGTLYYYNKRFDEAIGEYKKILTIDPSMTKSLFYCGMTAMQVPEKHAEAIKYFEDYLATNPEKDWEKNTKKMLGKLE